MEFMVIFGGVSLKTPQTHGIGKHIHRLLLLVIFFLPKQKCFCRVYGPILQVLEQLYNVSN